MGFWGIAGIIYLGTVGVAVTSEILVAKGYIAKKKRLGYVDKTTNESTIENIIHFLKNGSLLILFTFLPVVNFIFPFALFKFDVLSDNLIKDDAKKGNLIKIEELEPTINKEEYLAKRIAEVKEYQSKLGYKKQVHALSEYSTDEKIAMLLRELELLYEEKAREEGIEVTENKDLSQEKTVMKILEPQKETKSKK